MNVRPVELKRKMVEEVKKEAEFAHKLHHQNILIVCGTRFPFLSFFTYIPYSTSLVMAL